MQLTKGSAQLVLLFCSLVSAAPAPAAPVATISGNHKFPHHWYPGKHDNHTFPVHHSNKTRPSCGCDDEIESLLTSLNAYNAEQGIAGYDRTLAAVVTREDNPLTDVGMPIMDRILGALADSGLANVVIDLVLLDPSLLEISISGAEFVLKSGLVNLVDVMIALQKSGLVLQLLNATLDNPNILPGVLNIGKALLKENGIDIFNNHTVARYVADDKRDDAAPLASAGVLQKRESELINDLLKSLTDSGLALSVVEHLLTTPELAEPAVHFLSQILKSGALPLSELVDALNKSNLLLNLVRDILNDKDLLRKFGDLISDRITHGIISMDTYNNA